MRAARAALLAAAFGLAAGPAPAAARAGASPRAACAPVALRPAGSIAPRPAGVRGPLLVLAGSGLSSLGDSVLAWMRAHVRGAPGVRAGNVLILKASSAERDYSDGFYARARFASVQEIFIPPCAPRRAVDAVAPAVGRADVVLFAGGDQAHYAAWKGSALIAAVRRAYARGAIVGGGSAGLAIQGAVVYDSVAADRLLPPDEDLGTARAVRDPLTPAISFTRGLFAWPPLRGTITDTHFVRRDRFGRLVAFLARIVRARPGAAPLGLGIDEGSVVLVEPDGTATLRRGRGRGAYLVRLRGAAPLARGEPLRARVEVAHVARDGARFDLAHRRPGVPWRLVGVDGARTPYAIPDPYR